jgi:hypothetical protein
MKHMHTPSHTFIAVRFDTTGNVLRNVFDVVKKLSMVVTPANWRRKKKIRNRKRMRGNINDPEIDEKLKKY